LVKEIIFAFNPVKRGSGRRLQVFLAWWDICSIQTVGWETHHSVSLGLGSLCERLEVARNFS